ncbi:S9 family peptidase [Polymorphobacter arshaanensis]|uniref:S9 family peptidase n=1 Tax=Glacieibacterium arshaanense TaxID=2511025 RepID=A0A4Y9ELZ3_9SPHN|nr:S9 family peptidase [Polymorphobacter arshaanensis]TFU03075.1 S9 family peptidase [Polymorphobacter arshaanensis]
MAWRGVLAVLAAAGVTAVPVHGAPLSAYGALPGIDLVSIAPSGNRVGMVGVVGDARNLVVLDRAEQPVMLSPLGDFKVRGVDFADDSHVLVSLSNTQKLGWDFATDKFEATQVVVLNTETKKSLIVFQGKEYSFGGVFDSYGTATVDGKLSGFFSTITTERTLGYGERAWTDSVPDLYRVDLDSGRTKLLSNAGPAWRDWLVDSEGNVLVARDITRDTGAWTLRNPDSGRELAKGTDPQGKGGLVSLGRTPRTVVLSTRVGDAEHEWAEINVDSGASEQLLDDVAVSEVITATGTRLLIGYVASGDAQAATFFDKRREARMRGTVKAFPGLRVTYVDADSAFDRIIVHTDGPDDSGTYWRVDIPTGSADELGHDYPTIKAADIGPVSMFDYRAGDGLDLHGVLTLPRGRTPKGLPLIVLPHGGPAARDYPQFDWWAQALASRGYAVFQPNFRGSTGYGAKFRAAGYGQWGKLMQTDVSDGVAALAARGIIDPKRVCIMGASYGGYAALAGVTLQQGLYRCAVAVAGVSDLKMMFADEVGATGDRTQRRAWKSEFGAGTDLAAVSPAYAAARSDAPVLLIHGRDDTVVPYAQSERMAAQLRAAGKPVELVTLAGEDHWLSIGTTRVQMLEAAVAFVEKHNPPGGH